MTATVLLPLIRAQRWDEVGRALDATFYRHLLTDPVPLRAAFELLPEEWFERYPRHRMTRAIATTAGPRQLVDDDAFDAFVQWVDSQSAPQTRDLLGIEGTHLRRLIAVGNITGAVSHAGRIRQLIHDAADTRGFEDVLPALLLRVGQVHVLDGDLAAAADSLITARRFALADVPHPVDRHLRTHLALIDALHEQYGEAARRLPAPAAPVDECRSPMQEQLHIIELLVRALIVVCSGSIRQAEAALAAIAHEDELSDLWWVGVLARARAIAQWRNPRDGITLIRRALRDHASSSAPALLAGQLLRAELAGLHQATGALAAAEEALDPLDDDSDVFAVRAARIRGLLLRGDTDRAEQLLHSCDRADAERPSGIALALTIARLRGRPVEASALAQFAGVWRAADAPHALHQLPVPERGRILSELFPEREAFRSRYDYPALTSIPRLSAREWAVLRALRESSATAEIAERLHVSVNTVKTHRRNLYAKLGVRRREDALVLAERLWGEQFTVRG
ncbi:response regulator transcription factor [Microbacterium sp. NPDC055903]